MAKPFDLMFKILITGDENVGKTSLLQRFVYDNFPENYIPTIGIDFAIKAIDFKGKKIKLQIWDVAGQERFRTITSAYYSGCHGVLLVYDVTNQESLNNISDRWLSEAKKYDTQKILVGNKSDLNTNRIVDFDTAKTFADDNKLTYMESSAQSSSNVTEVFMTLIEDIVKNMPTDSIAAKPTAAQNRRKKQKPEVTGSRTCTLL